MNRWSSSACFTYALMLTLAGSIFSVASNIQSSYGSHSDIEVELDATVYDQNDSVTITGTINGGEENEAVDITIHLAGGGTDNEDTDISNDDGDFNAVYEVPSSADDGIYQVEVEFAGEDPVSTFFIVDEDSDIIDVSTEDSSYQAGEEVTIEGAVDQDELQTDVVEVEITVIDSDGETVLDSKDVDIENDGDFSSDDLTLDNNAPHGMYGIIVEYDNVKGGFFVFEVEDEDASNSITASLSSTSYEPGDEVKITGEVESIEPGDDVVITVEKPDGTDVFKDAEPPETDRSFTFAFDLDEDAVAGTYKVTIQYISTQNEKVLTFTVSTGTSGGGTGSGSGSSGGLTAKLNKVEFLAGETMTITGVVPTIREDEPVAISIIGPDGIFSGSAAYPEPESDKSYSASLRLKSSLEPDEDYRAVISYDNKEVTINFDITGVSTDAGPLSVKTDKTTYSTGSTVKITGQVSEDLAEGLKVIIRAENPNDEVYRYDLVTPTSDGSYSYSMVLGGDLEVNGEWVVTAYYGEDDVETTFQLGTGGGTSDGKLKYNLKIEDETYPIEYKIESGSIEIEEMIINYLKKKLVISVNADADGELTLVLPREVIDAVEGNGTDIKYIVTTRDYAVGDDVAVDVSESQTDDETRTLVIDYEAGTDIIEIAGTTVVPEFGPLSAIILAVAIVGMMAATARFSGRTNLFRP